MDYDYFYEEESEQFAFYRIPKVLFTDERFRRISTSAKVLYGLLLDRVSLSEKNRWFDEQGRIYIYYTLESIQANLLCANEKATKLLKELERYGLIERTVQGLCKPNRIYVKNFIRSRKTGLRNHENRESGVTNSVSLESRKSNGNNTDITKTEYSDTDLISSGDENRMEERKAYRKYFMDALAIDLMKERYPYDTDAIDEILELILDTVCTSRKTIGIAGEQRPAEVVKSRFMKLDSSHLEFVLKGLSENTTLVKNMKQYLLAALYNAPLTINNYYKSLVHHDMAEGNI